MDGDLCRAHWGEMKPFNSSVYVLSLQRAENQQDFTPGFDMKTLTHPMETPVSPLCPRPTRPVRLSPACPTLLETLSPQRETQRHVWPSSAGLVFSGKADLKGFLSELPRLLRQSGAEAWNRQGEFKRAGAWAAPPKPARPWRSGTRGRPQAPRSIFAFRIVCPDPSFSPERWELTQAKQMSQRPSE